MFINVDIYVVGKQDGKSFIESTRAGSISLWAKKMALPFCVQLNHMPCTTGRCGTASSPGAKPEPTEEAASDPEELGKNDIRKQYAPLHTVNIHITGHIQFFII